MGNLVFQAASGGQVALSGPNTASSFTIAVPAVTGTLVTTGDTGTVTTTMLASTTGSGAVVLATSPTLVTPALGTPSAIVLTNATGLPISTGLSGLTTNGVAYASSTSALATGSALTFDGTTFGVGTALTNGTKANVMGGDNVPATSGSTQNGGLRVSSLTSGNGGYVLDMGVSNTNGYAWMQVSNSSNLASGFTKDLVINPVGGNLGLGVTPIGWGGNVLCLHGDSALAFQGANGLITANAYYNGGWKYTTTAAASYYYQIGGAHQWTTAPSGTAGNPITFTQAMTLDASANLLVGTTSTSVTNGGYAFLINGGASYAPIGHATGTSSGAAYLAFRYNNSDIGSITQSGTTAVLYNLTSDQRLKENIKDAEDAATLIDAIQVRQYDWKSDGSHQRYGFIAQELVTVAPEAVHQPTDPDEMMAVDYSKLVPMLVKEIQSLRKRILTLENK